MLERKIRYDGTTAEYECQLLHQQDDRIVLSYKVPQTFSISGLTIPSGSYTMGFYWKGKPYNLYLWRDPIGTYLGAYFNIVKNTVISENMVAYEDLIIDLLVLPDGEFSVLDEEELSQSLNIFEDGYVKRVLDDLIEEKSKILLHTLSESLNLFGKMKSITDDKSNC